MNAVTSHISVAEIIALAAKQGHCTPAAIKGKRRFKHLVKVRFRAMTVARMIRQDKSLPTLGRLFGGRDHSTVHHALKQQYLRVHQDPQEAQATEALWLAAMLEASKRQRATHERAIAALRQQELALEHACSMAARMTDQVQ